MSDPNRRQESLEEKMNRKMAEFSQSKTNDSKQDKRDNVRGSESTQPSLEERMRRKMAEFEKPKQNSKPLDDDKSSIENKSQSSSVPAHSAAAHQPSLEERIKRKMEQFERKPPAAANIEDASDQQRTAAATTLGSSESRRMTKTGEMNNKLEATTDKGPAQVHPRHNAANFGKPAKLNMSGTRFIPKVPGSARMPDNDETSQPLSRKNKPEQASLQERMERKMAAFAPPTVPSPPQIRPHTSGEILLDMEMDVDRIESQDFELTGPVVAVSRNSGTDRTLGNVRDGTTPTPQNEISEPESPVPAAASAPMPTGVPLRQTTRFTKHRDQHQGQSAPGAYQVASRAAGSRPAWHRRFRDNLRSLSARMLTTGSDDESAAGAEGTGTNDQSHLPPEMRTTNTQSGQMVPLEAQNTSNVPPELRGSAGTNPSVIPSESDQFVSGETALEVTVATTEKESKALDKNKKRWCIIAIVLLFAIIGASIAVAVLLSGNSGAANDGDRDNLEPRATLGPSVVPTAAPSIDPEEPCEFENFGIDRGIYWNCECYFPPYFGVSQETQQFYEDTVVGFVESFDSSFQADRESCDHSTIAAHWLAGDILSSNSSNTQSWRNRYLLASIFIYWVAKPSVLLVEDRFQRRRGWLSNLPECDWLHIVECTNSSQITSIDINDNGLVGFPEQLFLLEYLRDLKLYANQFHSWLPTSIERLSHLESLFIQGSSISKIPESLFSLTNLRRLSLQSNNFAWRLSPVISNLTSLEHLDLSETGVNGEIPTEIGLLTGLKELYMVGANIVGGIPSEFGILSTLEIVNLAANTMRIHFPTEIGRMSALQDFNVELNDGDGTIPTEFGQLRNLKVLRFSAVERDSISHFTGTLPSEIGLMENLTELVGPLHKLTGTLPSEIGQLSKLSGLDLGDNMITGSLPEAFGNLSTLEYLRLRNLDLSGPYPMELGSIVDPVCFDFVGTSLTGTLPSDWCSDNTKILVPCFANVPNPCGSGSCCICDGTDDCSLASTSQRLGLN